MSSSDVTLHAWSDVTKEAMSPTIQRQLVTGDRVMVARFEIAGGTSVPMHSHENEQICCVVSGALRFTLERAGGPEITVRAGEVLHLPANVPHAAEAIEDVVALDIFSPPRQDWLDGDDAYLRDT